MLPAVPCGLASPYVRMVCLKIKYINSLVALAVIPAKAGIHVVCVNGCPTKDFGHDGKGNKFKHGVIRHLLSTEYFNNCRRHIMNRLHNNVILFCMLSFTVFIFGPFYSPASAASVDDEVIRIQKAYENIKDIRGGFVQKSFMKDLKKKETFKGSFYIKRPLKVKWSYEGDNAQDVLINNDEITIYQKKEKQAFQGTFDRETYGQAPIALLGGFGKIQDEFTVTDKQGKLLLKPKKPLGGILSIEMELSDSAFPIKSFTVIDSYSNRITMDLTDVKINTGLEDSFFSPAIPKDVTIFRQNL
jgi:outer membrane lipoprotein carrier protein